MINIFEVFLPQLLRYPNPNDPLNGEAAALLMRHPKEYDAKVKGVQLARGINHHSSIARVLQNMSSGLQRRRPQMLLQTATMTTMLMRK
jgi:hypothetical protein